MCSDAHVGKNTQMEKGHTEIMVSAIDRPSSESIDIFRRKMHIRCAESTEGQTKESREERRRRKKNRNAHSIGDKPKLPKQHPD